jgi:uncharacterized protein (DUF362 family)
MKKGESSKVRLSRRSFLTSVGASAAGLLFAPYLTSGRGLAHGRNRSSAYLAQVAITQNDNYTRTVIKQKVQHLFDSLGGISDVVKAGDKVAVKINLTGGSGSASSSKLGGLPITESMWTHPEVVRAVGELLIDAGVSGSNIYLVEALWDTASFMNFGYEEVRASLGAQMVNLNTVNPYTAFVSLPVGANKFNFDSFTVNQILSDVNVYVSIPKLKQHYEAGVTASLKNQVGIVPKQLYTVTGDTGRRGAIHSPVAGSSTTYLPRSICDLNSARPVHLAVIDGIKNARGGEGVWNSTWQLWQDHVLLAGKSPVATDSVGAYLMGNNPEAATLRLPAGGQCDNYLELLHQKGVGTNLMSEIQVVGDGAGLVSVREEHEWVKPDRFALYPNFPNPFNPSTTFSFYLPVSEHVTVKIYSITGGEIETLVDGWVPQGLHQVRWSPRGIASGAYVCEMRAGGFLDRTKMIYQK